jgi:hypothetical protein
MDVVLSGDFQCLGRRIVLNNYLDFEPEFASCNGPIFSSSSKAKFFSLSPGCTAAIAKPGRVAV